MSHVFVCGLGAVSPAGWDVPGLCQAVRKGDLLPPQSLEWPGRKFPLPWLPVPNPDPRPAFLSHPRLRRTNLLTQYVVASAMEAASHYLQAHVKDRRLGLIVCLQAGAVQYSYRFFEETLRQPGTASPLLFPETVFAAPTSHAAALLADLPLAYTLVGDPASFLQGLALSVQWLEQGVVDACLTVGAEETHWLLADALWHFQHSTVISCGAGAICLTLDPALSIGVELSCITDAHTYTCRRSREVAAKAMRAQLATSSPAQLLCDGVTGNSRADGPELAAWRDWTGPRLSPKRALGEGLMAAAAWQCVAACDALTIEQHKTAIVSLVGSNQQAIGAVFIRI